MLRWRTWLSPGIPYELFEVVARHVSAAVEMQHSLDADETVSGPACGGADPFGAGLIDLGFLCTPSFRVLAAAEPSTVQLVGAAPVWSDPRNDGRPLYFAEVVVAADTWAHAGSLADLVGARFGMNDAASMSGWGALTARAAALGLDDGFLGTPITTGGHLRSLQMLRDREIDAAAIDSNTLVGLGGLPDGLRVVETLGPFPVQPVVAAASLDAATVESVRSALLTLADEPATAAVLLQFGVSRFAAVSMADYR